MLYVFENFLKKKIRNKAKPEELRGVPSDFPLLFNPHPGPWVGRIRPFTASSRAALVLLPSARGRMALITSPPATSSFSFRAQPL